MNVSHVDSRDLRPAVGDVIFKKVSSTHRGNVVDEVGNRVAYPCRWFVYDKVGNGYPVEPAGAGRWVAVEVDS